MGACACKLYSGGPPKFARGSRQQQRRQPRKKGPEGSRARPCLRIVRAGRKHTRPSPPTSPCARERVCSCPSEKAPRGELLLRLAPPGRGRRPRQPLSRPPASSTCAAPDRPWGKGEGNRHSLVFLGTEDGGQILRHLPQAALPGRPPDASAPRAHVTAPRRKRPPPHARQNDRTPAANRRQKVGLGDDRACV